MTAEQAVAILGGVVGLVVALTALIVQVRGLRTDINGRMTKLVEAVSTASHKEGELEGRDYAREQLLGPPASPNA